MTRCKECDKEFFQNRPFQVFCGEPCKGAYHRRRYRQMAVEEAVERREARVNGHGTPEQRRQATEELAQIVEEYQNERQPKPVRRV